MTALDLHEEAAGREPVTTATVGRAMSLAVSMAAPLLVYGIVFNVALGFASRLAPALQVFFIAQPLNLLLSTEQFSEEIIRTLGSGIGLVLSVPLTTGVAALTVAGAAAAGGGSGRDVADSGTKARRPRRAI